jgi:lipopolysaccharide transport protein LptA
VHLENIARFVVDRLEEDPVIVSAALGDYEGEPGQRVMRFTKKVQLRDPIHGLVLNLPALEVDEAAGEARCTTELTFEGPTMSGHAASLVYGLRDQPTELTEAVLVDAEGLTVRAKRARLLDGLDDVELREEVTGNRGAESFQADRLRWKRDAAGELREMESAGSPASAVLMLEDGTDAEVVGRNLDAKWDAGGLVEAFAVEGEGFLRRDGQTLAADRISGQRSGDAGNRWDVRAEETVYLSTIVGGDPAWLRANSLQAEFDVQFILQSALAVGQVRFEGPETRAEADRATFHPGQGRGEIRLQAVERPKARLARGRIRVAGQRINTDPQGTNLVVEGKVEATMLPGADETNSVAAPGMFRVEDAVHFVSKRLEGRDGGTRLTFTGGVRGWQQERNLAAETVIMDQQAQTLTASVDVTTRMPRDAEQVSLSEADYVQIGADRLEYDERAKLAVYRDHVRVRLAEGWMEADRMEIELSDGEERIREVRAFDSVRIEFRDAEAGVVPRIIDGTADRMTYVPRERVVILYGDSSPAAVRRISESGGTTKGRVLRYRVDTGTLEVDAGEQGPARIRTGGAGGPTPRSR